jgi:hypothetical protein
MSKPFAIVTIQGRPCRVEARTKAKLAEALRKYIPLAWGPAERGVSCMCSNTTSGAVRMSGVPL